MDSNYQKQHAALRGFLIGRKYFRAMKAFNFAAEHHTGTRRNGDPEFSHQLGVVKLLRVLPDVSEIEEELIVCGILHDIVEDHNVPLELIQEEFGVAARQRTDVLTKIRYNTKLPDDIYYSQMLFDALVPLVKGADRCSNLLTASGAFKTEKMEIYIKETNDRVIPLLREAQRKYVQYHRAFECERIMLELALTGFGFQPVEPKT